MTRSYYSGQLRDASQAEWRAAVDNDFVRGLGDGTLPEAAFRGYLIQDYRFLDTLVSVVGFAVARAPDLPAKARYAEFLGVLTGSENDYFQRSFEALGVSERDLANTEDSPVLAAFRRNMTVAAEAGTYADLLSVFLPAEWIYLDWARSVADGPATQFYYREWIDMHAAAPFADFVGWLQQEMDGSAPAPDSDADRRIRRSFARMVELERAFFEESLAT